MLNFRHFLADILLVVTMGVIGFIIGSIARRMEQLETYIEKWNPYYLTVFWLAVALLAFVAVYALSFLDMSLPYLLSPLTAK